MAIPFMLNLLQSDLYSVMSSQCQMSYDYRYLFYHKSLRSLLEGQNEYY